MAEDSAVDRRRIVDHLKEWGFEAAIAEDGRSAWQLLEKCDAPNLVLLDWVLPHVDGIELCRRIRKGSSGYAYTYIVLLTAKDTKEDLLTGLEAGADDYLIKPFHPLELRARLLAGQRIIELQHRLIDLSESFRMAATYDPLTRLLNREHIVSMLTSELSRAGRDAKPVAIIMADIDNFKSINDTLGHLVGDSVLQEVSKRLKDSLRIYDGAGRYGGEEFLLVLPGCDLKNAALRAEQIRKTVCAESISTPKGPRSVTVSLGVTAANPDSTASPEALLNEADGALYRAKGKGRNCVEVAAARAAGRS